MFTSSYFLFPVCEKFSFSLLFYRRGKKKQAGMTNVGQGWKGYDIEKLGIIWMRYYSFKVLGIMDHSTWRTASDNGKKH